MDQLCILPLMQNPHIPRKATWETALEPQRRGTIIIIISVATLGKSLEHSEPQFPCL